jgi:hypothetical protein
MAHSCAARVPLNVGQKSSLCSHVTNHFFKRPNVACKGCHLMRTGIFATTKGHEIACEAMAFRTLESGISL